MSKTIQEPKDTATNRHEGFATAGQRRMKYGTNVLIMCLAALAVVIFLNVITFKKHWRRDLATAGVSQPSDRTKRVVDQLEKPVTLTTVYTGIGQENDREKYFPAVEDFLRELSLYAPGKVKISHVRSDAAKAELLARVQTSSSGQAGQYRDLIDEFDRFVAAATDTQAPASQPSLRQSELALTAALGAENGYLADFPQAADLQVKLTRDLQTLGDARDEVRRLVTATGLPRYTEAKDKIRETLDQMRLTLDAGQQDLASIAKMSQAAGDEFFQDVSERMDEMVAKVREVQDTVGLPEDQGLPEDPRAALQAYAKETIRTALYLNNEARRQEDLAGKYPALTEMPSWLARIQGGVIEQVVPLPSLVRQIAGEQMSLRDQVRNVLAMDNIAADRIAGVVRQIRSYSAQQVKIAEAVSQLINRLKASLGQIDPASGAVLARAEAGQWQQPLIARIDEIKTQIDALPEIKLTEIADKLEKTPNVIIAEAGEKVEVISFDDVWPQSQPLPGAAPEDAPRRVFNGDTAITASILSLSQPPLATVIFAHYQAEAPQQMRQFQPPQMGSIPYAQLEDLRQRLSRANLLVKEWNLAEQPDPPAAEQGTEPVYVFLPPPQDLPMPGPQQKDKKFGDAQVAKVKELIEQGSRAIFLCKWEPPTRAAFFMPPSEPTYAYEDLLRDTLGVNVLYKFRTVYGVPEQRQPGSYGVNMQRWAYMPLNNFTEMAIGEPLKNRRVLMLDVCPVVAADQAPEGLAIQPILEVPKQDEYWASADVLQLIQQVVGDERGGLTRKMPGDLPSGYTAALAVTSEDQPRAVVLGTGASVMNGYLGERVPRIGGQDERISFDPPPTANADLVINAVMWLAGRSDLIGAGPEVLPPVEFVPQPQMAAIRGLVWFLLPGLVLVSGAGVWAVRRK